jgi:hypothetical protein
VSGLSGQPVDNATEARSLLARSKGAVGNDRMSDGEVELTRLAVVLQAFVHGQLAAIDLMAQMSAPAAPAPVPADRVLYRDRIGDYWACDPDGSPYMLDGGTWGDLAGIRTIGDVEREYGPLHVAPWPGEVR